MSDKDFGPGIYSIAAERYQAASGVSKSMLDILAHKTPAHLQEYMRRPPVQSYAQEFGAILHRALLEPDTFKDGFYVRPDKMTFTTKEGKAWQTAHPGKPILTSQEALQITLMVSAVHTHPFAKRLLAGCEREQSLFVGDAQGTLRKSRLDALTKGNVIPDIKTTESASLENFERSISRYRLHVQAAYYLDNCNLAGIDKRIFFFICVEKIPPYAVRCLQLMAEVIEYGKILYNHDLQIYRNCLETGEWEAWGDKYDEAGLPTWEMKQLENATV